MSFHRSIQPLAEKEKKMGKKKDYLGCASGQGEGDDRWNVITDVKCICEIATSKSITLYNSYTLILKR